MNTQRPPFRLIRSSLGSGFSLLELVVVMAVLSLLMAVLIPAVQTSRNAAARIACVNSLKQISLAAQQYHDQFGMFATADQHMKKLLPSLEQNALFQIMQPGHSQATIDAFDLRTPGFLLCPSDPLIAPSRLQSNYHVCSGSGNVGMTLAGFELDGMALPSTQKGVRIRDVTDGTSTTAMYSERLALGDPNLVTDASAVSNRKQNVWYMNRDYTIWTEFERFQGDCLSHVGSQVVPILSPIFQGIVATVGYNHAMPPNKPGCYVIKRPRHLAVDFMNGALPPNSHHDGGVNVAFVDGHVRFVSETIDLGVWMALGSRNGQEAVSGEW